MQWKSTPLFNIYPLEHSLRNTFVQLHWYSNRMKSNEDNQTWISHILVWNICFMFKTSLLLLNFCLCVYFNPYITNLYNCLRREFTWGKQNYMILSIFPSCFQFLEGNTLSLLNFCETIQSRGLSSRSNASMIEYILFIHVYVNCSRTYFKCLGIIIITIYVLVNHKHISYIVCLLRK